ncbi:hypothetical protein, partial [Faecalibaculum rodentium]|uniref:hypothetical protein n=1 Tax=Faecalibaculum rodentium TaxID=1702221 RepID=UPI0025A0C8CD
RTARTSWDHPRGCGDKEPGRTLVTEKYFQGRTWESLQVRHGMSKAGMDYIIEREIFRLV